MRTVFVDVDTQIDFMFPAGALYVPCAERLVPTIARLNHHAAENGILVISTVDAHLEDDVEFRDWPAHCVLGTAGQAKPAGTLREKRVTVPATPGDYPIAGAQQIVVEKRWIDVFAGGSLPGIVQHLQPDRWVVYGVVTEYCVRSAALHLLDTGRPVEVVENAIQALDPAAGRAALDEITARGGRLIRL
jgi:nicotinamidase/pyrazinamidase